MIVHSEINRLLAKADGCYIELTNRYITQAKLNNDVISIFARLNVLKGCRKSLRTYDMAAPQITEVAFNHIADIIRGICSYLGVSGGNTTISLSDNLVDTIDPSDNNEINMDWLYHSFQGTVNGQSTFTGLPFDISNVDPEALRLTINGESMIYGTMQDYHIIGSTLHWHKPSLNVHPSDRLTIAYYKL